MMHKYLQAQTIKIDNEYLLIVKKVIKKLMCI